MNGICDLELPSKNKMKLYHCFELVIMLILSFTDFYFLFIGIRFNPKPTGSGSIVASVAGSFEDYEYLRVLLFANLIVYFIGFILLVCGISCQDNSKVKSGFKCFLVVLISLFIFFSVCLKEEINLASVAIPFLLIIGVTFCAMLIQIRKSEKFMNNLNR